MLSAAWTKPKFDLVIVWLLNSQFIFFYDMDLVDFNHFHSWRPTGRLK